MIFFIDTQDQTVTAHKKMGEAARAVLEKLGVTCGAGSDPVKTAYEALGERGVMQNLSQAFESIAESDDQAAQELALQMKQAVDTLYGN
ncbi:hypothetical protein [Marinomonas transparens]|uniref:Uncharacterized protein n=1 Tax=Marinomonas transparens TaxID=2795388 RepID=A0A934JJ09_9GAMM|nr:hypothetical protein [Marinomonas transparens]MBJ7536970.1 hypothetical protein [Marinomonas transparens]